MSLSPSEERKERGIAVYGAVNEMETSELGDGCVRGAGSA